MAVQYLEIEPATTNDAYLPRYWRDWAWVLERLPVQRGTPRFIVLKDREIVGNFFQGNPWPPTYNVIKTVLDGKSPYSF